MAGWPLVVNRQRISEEQMNHEWIWQVRIAAERFKKAQSEPEAWAAKQVFFDIVRTRNENMRGIYGKPVIEEREDVTIEEMERFAEYFEIRARSIYPFVQRMEEAVRTIENSEKKEINSETQKKYRRWALEEFNTGLSGVARRLGEVEPLQKEYTLEEMKELIEYYRNHPSYIPFDEVNHTF